MILFAVDFQIDYGFYPFIFSIYATVFILAGSLLTAIWLHAEKNELIDYKLASSGIQNVTLQSALTPIVFTISIPISFIDVQPAYYFWFTIIPAKIIIDRTYPWSQGYLD